VAPRVTPHTFYGGRFTITWEAAMMMVASWERSPHSAKKVREKASLVMRNGEGRGDEALPSSIRAGEMGREWG